MLPIFKFAGDSKSARGGLVGFPLFLIMVMFFVSTLAEINRVPFDLTEGESELVSRFNVEYRSFLFAMFFLAEYIHILLMSVWGVFCSWGLCQQVPKHKITGARPPS